MSDSSQEGAPLASLKPGAAPEAPVAGAPAPAAPAGAGKAVPPPAGDTGADEDSSSDEDAPLASRKPVKPEPKPEKETTPRTGSGKKEPVNYKEVQDSESSSSDEEDKKPIAARAKPKAAPAKKAAAAKQQDKSGKAAAAAPKKPAPKRAVSSAGEGSQAAGPKREKKVFDLPGQTRETPDETDPLRKFYTSLRQQRPDSEMAAKWCVQYGLLPREEAEAWVLDQAQRKGSKVSPVKAPAKRGSTAAPASKRKRAAAASEDEDAAFKPAKKPTAKKAEAGAKKPAAKKPAAAAAGNKPPPARDVAFADGGMDGSNSDSDENVPLLARRKA